jgi:hypothetical protein
MRKLVEKSLEWFLVFLMSILVLDVLVAGIQPLCAECSKQLYR